MAQFAQLYGSGTIRYTQTSFLELVTAMEVHRIDFVGKHSFHLRRGTGGPLSYHIEHPLLRGYGEPHTALYLNTRPMRADTEALLAELQQELNELAGEWRHLVRGSWHPWWRRIVAHNLAGGQGVLLDTVPVFAAEAGARVCARHGVTTYFYPRINPQLAPRPTQYALLLIGQNYVIAQDFRVSTLCCGFLL